MIEITAPIGSELVWPAARFSPDQPATFESNLSILQMIQRRAFYFIIIIFFFQKLFLDSIDLT